MDFHNPKFVVRAVNGGFVYYGERGYPLNLPRHLGRYPPMMDFLPSHPGSGQLLCMFV